MSLIQGKKKVGIVTFGNEVDVYGDGCFPEKLTIAGDKLYDENQIRSAVEEVG